MRRFVDGRLVDIPEESDGVVDVAVVRREAGATPRDVVIEQTPQGDNFILPKKGDFMLQPGSHLMLAPLVVRGA